MSSKNIEDQVTHVVQLFQGKKMKQIKKYVDQIENSLNDGSNQAVPAEGIMLKALEKCLVQKRSQPVGMLTALYTYKQLVSRAIFQYTQQQAFQEIHKFVYKTCSFNPTGDLANRGKSYFKDILKVELTQQLQNFGTSIVTLALEIVHNFAVWYETDFFTDEKSRYSQYLNKLIEKKVKIVEIKDSTYFKPEDHQKFKQKYKAFIKRMQEQEEDEQQNDIKKNENKDNFKKIEGPAISKVPQSSFILEDKGKKDQQKENEVKIKQRQRQEKEKQIQRQKQQQRQKQLQRQKDQQRAKQQERIKEQERAKELLREQQRLKELERAKEQARILEQEKKKEQQRKQKEKERREKQREEQIAKEKQMEKQRLINIEKQKRQKIATAQKEEQQRKRKQEEAKRNIIKEKQSEIEATFILKNQQQSYENTEFINQKDVDSNLNQTLLGNNSPNNQTRKIRKQQKYVKQYSNFYSNFNMAGEQSFSTPKKRLKKMENISLNRKGLPKTENRKNATVQNFYSNQNLSNLHSSREQLQYMRLKDFRQRKKIVREAFVGNVIAQKQTILSLLQTSNLYQLVIPYVPEYFHPITQKMSDLREEAVRVGQSIRAASKYFFQNNLIETRLIKSSNSYILSVHNISTNRVQIGISYGLQASEGNQFSRQIKIEGLNNKKFDEPTLWKIAPNEFLDIGFDFYTSNPNFKFLLFPILVNQSVVKLHLPITLLDQGVIDKFLDLEQISQYIKLSGRLLKTAPIVLDTNKQDLSSIFNFSRYKDNVIAANSTFYIEKEPNLLVKVTFLIKKVKSIEGKFEILALYDNENHYNEDFAKVLLELFYFLLAKQIL